MIAIIVLSVDTSRMVGRLRSWPQNSRRVRLDSDIDAVTKTCDMARLIGDPRMTVKSILQLLAKEQPSGGATNNAKPNTQDHSGGEPTSLGQITWPCCRPWEG